MADSATNVYSLNRRAVSGNNQRITETRYQDNFVSGDSLASKYLLPLTA
jgi:hypothetical protein